MKETLKADRKREIVKRFLNQLVENNPDLYYSTTKEIARLIHKNIQLGMNRLSIDEQTLVKRITIRDVEIILSVKS